MNSKAIAGLVAGALVIGLFVGLALGGGNGGTNEAAGPGPTKIVAGAPVGYERSKAGAVRAALNYEAALSAAVELAAPKRRNLVEAMVLRSRAEEILDDFEVGYRLVDQNFGLSSGARDAIVRSGILGYQVKAYDPAEAEVAVWEVAIAAREGTPPAAGGWSTTTLRLRWAGDWKLAATPARVDGPTPGATDNKQLVPTVRELEGVRYVPAQ